ncbi:MAG: lipopolysaccharide biosynthesis protein [Pseudomonadota bacterium]
MSTLTDKVARGAAFNVVAAGVRIGSALLVLPILARFLEPRDFGIVQMGMPFVLLLMFFGDMGISPALVRAENPSRALWSSAFWTTVGLSVSLAILQCLSAPLIADFFGEPELVSILYALAAILIVQSFGIMHYSWLQRALRFRTIAIIDIASHVAGMIVAIYTGLQGAGAWALVYQQVTLYVAKTTGLLLAGRPPIGFIYDFSEIRKILRFSLAVVGTQVVNFVGTNADTLLIGRFLGATPLGYYSLALRLIIVPIQTFSSSLTGILLPALAQAQNQPERFKAASLKLLRTVTFITFPLMAGIAAMSEPIIEVLLGQRMAAVAPLASVLALVGAIRSVAGVHGAILMALGRSDVMFRWAVINNVGIVIAVSIGVQWGLMGVCVSILVVSLMITGPANHVLATLIGASLWELFQTLVGNLINAIGMGLVVYSANLALADIGFSDLERLLLCCPLGVVVYAGGALLFQREASQSFVEMIRRAIMI